jgi:hypothetical protein
MRRLTSVIGTNRTCRSGLMMSDIQGTPEPARPAHFGRE